MLVLDVLFGLFPEAKGWTRRTLTKWQVLYSMVRLHLDLNSNLDHWLKTSEVEGLWL